MFPTFSQCFGRHSPDPAGPAATLPQDPVLRSQAHDWLDRIDRIYKDFPKDIEKSYQERALVVRKNAIELSKGGLSSEIDARLCCHAQEMESLKKEGSEGGSWVRDVFRTWDEAPRNVIALQAAFVQLDGIWPLPPPDQRAQIELGMDMEYGDPEGVFRMRPIYEQLVRLYDQDRQRKKERPSWGDCPAS